LSHLDLEREIRRILRDRLRVDVPESRAELLDSGLVDSLGFVDLVAAIEQRFEIVVSLIDVDLDEFRTIESIARFVSAARGGDAEARAAGSAPPAMAEAASDAIVTVEAS